MRKADKERDAEILRLTKENAALKRKVLTLRKSLRGTQEVSDEEEEPLVPAPAQGAPSKWPCPGKCGTYNTRIVQTPTSRILVCATCQARRKM